VRILDIRSLDGPNVYHNQPVLVMRLDLEDVVETHSAMIEGYVDRLLALLPELAQHRCSPGYIGGFVKRLRDGTYPAHIVEHVAIALSERAGFDIGFGKARHSGEGSIYNVIIRFRARRAMRYLLEKAVALVDATMRGEPFDADEVVAEARRIAVEEAPAAGARELIARACDRRIPVRLSSDGARIHLGHGCFATTLDAATASAATLESLFPEGTDGRIPIVAVAGSHRAGAVASLIARMIGDGVGVADREGIRIASEIITTDDATGPEAARALLEDTRVDAAVIEVSWRGIVRGGLGYEWSDIAVLTDVAADDIGEVGIEEIDDLTNIYSVVAEREREGGAIILDGDDEQLRELATSERIARLPRRIILESGASIESLAAAAVNALTGR
jgi:hypothetical protein